MTAPFPVRLWPTLAGVAVAAAVGGLVGGGWRAAAPLPRVAALTSLADDSFAVCTAPLDGSVEGFFILDFETGDLSGGALNPGTSKFGVSYRHNVLEDLGFKAGKVKDPKFLLVPGMASFGGPSGARMAQSVLYVTDAATGVTVAYGIPWAGQQPAAGAGPLQAKLMALDVARPRATAAKVQ